MSARGAQHDDLIWVQPEWLAEATAWIREHVEVAGEIEQPHIRWWSTVLRVPTPAGDVWFKANSELHRFEAELVSALEQWRPGALVPLVAADHERGWMLMGDGGTRLREVFASDPDPTRWAEILPGYAELQIDGAARRDELLALGVPSLLLSELPSRCRKLLDDTGVLLLNRQGGLSSEEYRLLRELDVGEMVERLAAYGIPETLQHDDLHDGNVFAHAGGYRIFDWGDSCVSHPFHTLVVALRAAAWKFDLEPGARVLLRLRDAYLEPWTCFAPRAELLEAFDLAYRVGTLARALAWHRFVRATPPWAVSGDDVESVPYGLRLFLEHGPIGAWR